MFEGMCWREGTGGRGGTMSVDGGKRSSIMGRRVLCIYIVEYMYSIIYICCQFYSMYSDYAQLGIPM